MMGFDEIFWAVAEAHNLTAWYEIYDSEVFDEVMEKIVCAAGLVWTDDDDLYMMLCDNVEGFEAWEQEMAEEL